MDGRKAGKHGVRRHDHSCTHADPSYQGAYGGADDGADDGADIEPNWAPDGTTDGGPVGAPDGDSYACADDRTVSGADGCAHGFADTSAASV